MTKYLRHFIRRVAEGILPPKPIEGLKIQRSHSMKTAILRISWLPSPSVDVVQYNVLVVDEDNQNVLADRVVSFAETQLLIPVLESTNITATVVANDGVFDSLPVSASYSVGDLTAPAPVGGVTIELVEVLDIEDEDPDPIDDSEGGDNDEVVPDAPVAPIEDHDHDGDGEQDHLPEDHV